MQSDSNRTVAGLKPSPNCAITRLLDSNRTVAGLKRPAAVLLGHERDSNRTVAGLKLVLRAQSIHARFIQIAPLRD